MNFQETQTFSYSSFYRHEKIVLLGASLSSLPWSYKCRQADFISLGEMNLRPLVFPMVLKLCLHSEKEGGHLEK